MCTRCGKKSNRPAPPPPSSSGQRPGGIVPRPGATPPPNPNREIITGLKYVPGK